MSELKVSVSGIRGIWGDSLTLKTLFDFTKAFGYYILRNKGKRVLLGRDARPTGEMISIYTAGILNAMGIDVINTGIVPTPTVLYGVRKLGLDGGLIITASHNPVEWNALKFVKKGGTFTGEKDLEVIKGFINADFREASFSVCGKYSSDDSISDMHISEVMNHIDSDLIREKAFRVLLDPVNSAGSVITHDFLKKLGCTVKVINGEITGSFSRGTEPTPKNLAHMEKEVLDFKADAGFAQDPDADRLVVIDENGRVLSEEWTTALAIEDVLSQKKGDIVINMSTSMIEEIIAEKYGVKCFRTKVGEANVVEGIEKHKALIGGEGNGGVIYPAINTARDSLVGIGLTLELLARTGKKLSEITEDFPKLFMIKEKFDFKGSLDILSVSLKKEFHEADINELDGIRFYWKEGNHPVWVHVRSSNTEPIVRVMGESTDETLLNRSLSRVRKHF